MTSKTINIKYLTRVEGEGALYLKIRQSKVEELRLKIFEPPRFFEAFMRGRKFTEAPDITARICGICPVAYQMSSVHAMEDAIGLKVPAHISALRRLLYCGEWIESHGLHVFMLSAPDFLGYQDAIAMARDHKSVVERGLRLKKAGNTLVSVIGGREIHPINVRVGGFYKMPDKQQLLAVREELLWAREAAIATYKWAETFSYPQLSVPVTYVSLVEDNAYAICDGKITSSHGLSIAHREYEDHFYEEHVPYTNALHARLKDGGGTYLTGPMARVVLNRNHLTTAARELADRSGFWQDTRNPFRAILARCMEIIQACEEGAAIISNYDETLPPFIEAVPRQGRGYWATEAPRGTLYHRYDIDADGLITEARIVPPTSQNQAQIEADLHHFVSGITDLPKDQLTHKCEMAVRNYDPCISCATHFLQLDLDRDGTS